MAAFISTYADRYFLQATGDTAAVGLYSLAYTFGFMLMVLGHVPFMQVWESKRFEIAKLDDRDAYLAKGFVYMNLLLITVAVGIALFVGDLLRIMAAPAFFSAAQVVPLILIAYVFQAWTNALDIGILVGKPRGFTRSRTGSPPPSRSCFTRPSFHVGSGSAPRSPPQSRSRFVWGSSTGCHSASGPFAISGGPFSS